MGNAPQRTHHARAVGIGIIRQAVYPTPCLEVDARAGQRQMMRRFFLIGLIFFTWDIE